MTEATSSARCAVQGSLFADAPAPAPRGHAPGAEALRGRLGAVVAAARAAPGQPWPDRDVRFWRTVLPQMSDWLPDDEAEDLRAAFAAELARLGST